ncbi:MAG: hypothetical protein HYU71_15705 [Bacteroidetes bacterium]|nr:hypothetical protein [Bacteroidota bacterium]
MNVSLLLGSGFSIPEGLPSVQQLNKRLGKISEEEIIIGSNQISFFLNGQTDNNRWSRWDERMFLQKFLEYYNDRVLREGLQFHYETFYDFYSSYLADKNSPHKEAIETFYSEFNKTVLKGQDGHRDCYNRINDFNRTFNQLVASLLFNNRYVSDISCLNYGHYDAFIGFISHMLEQGHTVHVHTLNHDLFFDYLGRHHSNLFQHFSDGYTLAGSPYYGMSSFDWKDADVSKSYYVKLEYFTGNYEKPLRLYKLHGSIDSTIGYTELPDQQRVHIKSGYGISEYFIEAKNQQTGKSEFRSLHNEIAPDFLTGTTNKIRFYSNDLFYKSLFNHFTENISASSLMIVIGYGFHDPGINSMLEKFFLPGGNPMIIIDPVRPDDALLEKYQTIRHIQAGVTQVSFSDYMKLLDV